MSDLFYQPCWPESEQALITPHDDVCDIAALEELSERIFTALDAAFTHGGDVAITYSTRPGDHIYQALIAEQGLTFLLPGFRTFPPDRVPAMLTYTWPAPIIEAVLP